MMRPAHRLPSRLASLLAAFAIQVSAAPYEIKEEIVGPAWEHGTVYTLSPSGLRVATLSAKGSRFVVTVDGVEGPPFEEVFATAGDVEVRYDLMTLQPVLAHKWQGPVAFSPDGKRHAYTARIGQEVMVMLDNREIYRAPYSASFPPVARLFFSPDSRQLFFYARTTDTLASHRLMVDGKPASPAFAGTPEPFFSADGRRWGLLAARPGASGELMLVLDGKEANYVGLRPQFTADGRRVVSLGRQPGKPDALLVDGKPLFTAQHIETFEVASNGSIAAIATAAGGEKKRLFLNGKPVPGVEGVAGVVFSPDGKRWAAWCIQPPSSWVVVDGKRQQDYQRVADVVFSPDSSRLIYTAEAGVKRFVVVDGIEDSGATNILVKPFFASRGNAYAYAVAETGSMDSRRAVINGERHPLGRYVHNLQLSPDGSRHAYYRSVDALVSRLVVDGQEVGAENAEGSQLVFSPDGRHIAALARPLVGNQGRSLYVDGEYFGHDEVRVNVLMGFTPDSRHVLAVATENRRDVGAVQRYSMNGQVVAEFGNRGVAWANTRSSHRLWEAQPDGSVLLVGTDPVAGQNYGPMKRVRVIPAANSTIATWIAQTKEGRTRAVAEAEARKAQAEADRLAAAEERKRQQEEAAAARRKAQEEASAARKKAQEEAAAARAKAREEAAAKAKR
jgi:hypothetical protein